MNLIRDLQYVGNGEAPATILALVRMGYATYPPARLTLQGVALLHKLTDADETATIDPPRGSDSRV